MRRKSAGVSVIFFFFSFFFFFPVNGVFFPLVLCQNDGEQIDRPWLQLTCAAERRRGSGRNIYCHNVPIKTTLEAMHPIPCPERHNTKQIYFLPSQKIPIRAPHVSPRGGITIEYGNGFASFDVIGGTWFFSFPATVMIFRMVV